MRFEKTGLDGAYLIHREPMQDHRGFFARTFCVREFGTLGLETSFPQHSISHSHRKATLRGMHFQRSPFGEVKVVRCLTGSIFDVIIDLRPNSPTFGQWRGFELSAERGDQLYIPQQFAHGFQALTDAAQVSYLISAFYQPDAAAGYRYDDPAFNISWPYPVSEIAAKDLTWPVFKSELKADAK